MVLSLDNIEAANYDTDPRRLQPAAFTSEEGVDTDSEGFCKLGRWECCDDYEWRCEIDIFRHFSWPDALVWMIDLA